MEKGNAKWNRELLVHSILRGLIGFVLLEALMVWLGMKHPGGEPDGFSMIVTGILGVLNGYAACCCFYQNQRKAFVRFSNYLGTWTISCQLPQLIIIVVLSIIMAIATLVFFCFKVEFPIVCGINFCLMIIYGYDRSYRVKHLKELIRSSFER